jgi:hypothetical protein
MTRVGRSVALAAAAALVAVVAPGSPVQAAGPDVALQHVCEDISHGTWTASDLRCLVGPDPNVPVPTAAVAICEHPLAGEVLPFGTLPNPMFGWTCVVF